MFSMERSVDAAGCAKPESKILPWAQYLKELIPRIETVLAPDVLSTFENKIFSLVPNTTLDTGRPFCADRRSDRFNSNSELIGHDSKFHLYLYSLLVNRYRVPKNVALELLSKQFTSFCEREPPTCDPAQPYRTIDGSCNNLVNSLWGASFRPLERILPHAYDDGFTVPRGGSDGGKLPNPRLISTTINYDVIKPDLTITNMVPVMGNFFDHDITFAPEGARKCCTTDIGYEDCFPIAIPEDDPFYSNLPEPQTCMSVTRSTPFCFPGPSGVREQFNMDTAIIDASQVYGSDDERAKHLREFAGGRLLAHKENKNLLPTVKQVGEIHNIDIPVIGTFLAGDDRVNEMPTLTLGHILLFREHNRIAGLISALKQDWTDEEIFQKARRILIAEWQNVIFGEYLPVIMGEDAMLKYGLQLDDGAYSVYDPTINPGIFQAFSTAAYRFGHTLVNGIIQLFRGLQEMGSYEIKDQYFESDQIESNNGDGYNLIMGGLLVQNAQIFDPHVTVGLSNYLFKERSSSFGSDLVAINIQRARDHGVPAYTDYRQFCQLTPLTTWEEKPEDILQETWDSLQTLYASPLDIDLYTGGLSEVPVAGAISGATFICLKGLQFQRLKYGDRFFLTHGDQVGSFSLDQLKHLRTRTLGDIVCENSAVDMTPTNVFRTASESNPQLFCNDPTRAVLDLDLLLQ